MSSIAASVCDVQLFICLFFINCNSIEQEDFTTPLREAASVTMRPSSALLIGTKSRVRSTPLTTVQTSHAGCVFYFLFFIRNCLCVFRFISVFSLHLGRHWHAGCGRARTVQREPLAYVPSLPTVHGSEPEGQGRRGSPRTLLPSLDRKRVACSRGARSSTRAFAR